MGKGFFLNLRLPMWGFFWGPSGVFFFRGWGPDGWAAWMGFWPEGKEAIKANPFPMFFLNSWFRWVGLGLCSTTLWLRELNTPILPRVIRSSAKIAPGVGAKPQPVSLCAAAQHVLKASRFRALFFSPMNANRQGGPDSWPAFTDFGILGQRLSGEDF